MKKKKRFSLFQIVLMVMLFLLTLYFGQIAF